MARKKSKAVPQEQNEATQVVGAVESPAEEHVAVAVKEVVDEDVGTVDGTEATEVEPVNEDDVSLHDVENEANGGVAREDQSETPAAIASDHSAKADLEEKVYSDDYPAPRRAAKKKRVLEFLLAGTIVVGILIGLYWLYFAARAQPGVQVAGAAVSGSSRSEIERVATSQIKAIRIQFKTPEKTVTALPSTAGITFDPKTSATKALQSKRSLLERLSPWKVENVPLAYTVNRTALDAYLEKNIADGWKLPKDASLTFDPSQKQYVVVDAISGEGVQYWQVKQAVEMAASRPRVVTAAIHPVPTSPKITNRVAKAAQQKANTFLKSDIKMLQAGKRVFYLEPQEIDTLLDIIPDAQKGTIDVTVNESRVQKFVDTDITNTVARAARERVVIVNPDTNQTTVLQEGSPGQKLAGNKKLATDITTALRGGTAYAKEITVEDGGAMPEKRFTGKNRWAEVNLSQQMAYMHLDDQVIMSFRISSGRAVTPTDPGEWNVYGKIPIQTMKGVINGEAYEVPNVPWVVYFHDGEAFHGTYWHNNFGTPMSHGCINMPIADAKMMYNFAYMGMRVSVHY
ncbi:MAG: hypothetical protein QG629_280 [Patescibacteria group bacterium]|nr:L,D-transpeptidase family protein [Candidatus Saccharibacteria bacterium]MDQ5963198.1 hypothetical protein [Patescibacteria group bacterium]